MTELAVNQAGGAITEENPPISLKHRTLSCSALVQDSVMHRWTLTCQHGRWLQGQRGLTSVVSRLAIYREARPISKHAEEKGSQVPHYQTPGLQTWEKTSGINPVVWPVLEAAL